MMNPQQVRIRSFEVVPSLPEPLKPLLELAHNLWWSWHPEAVELFTRLDRDLWDSTHHNPVKMLGLLPQSTLDAYARDREFLSALDHVQQNLKRHLTRKPWLESRGKGASDFTVAYFCAEFGLAEALQIYSGGLGVLAGDHLKSAAELALPMVAVGLLYRNGYFQQYLNPDGWQQEYYPNLDLGNLPLRAVRSDDGEQLKVRVRIKDREVAVAVWLVQVGRVPLYLLDTNVPENHERDRHITSQLYGGDMETRIRQEMVLGIAGVRALEAVGVWPDVCHMNEGHSAFLALERIRRLIETHDVSFDEARHQAAASHVFTTHTPVPAGIDRFPPDMMLEHFKSYHEGLRLDQEGLLALGREDVGNREESFSMAVLALRTSEHANGVSRLHGRISRSLWSNIWPDMPDNEVPITHVTNGVHARSWLSADLIYLLDQYIGKRWQNDPADQTVWQAVHEVPDEELWRLHERRRQALIVWTRRRLRDQLEARGVNADYVRAAADALDPNALTIGFARRFAAYKRGSLILHDPERFKAILNNAQRPVQILISGKAHPADGEGKDLIRQLVQFARESEGGHRIVFLENYDIGVARQLVAGCDLWLNTPRRSMEASGTSGMKAALNGVLNCSILDGWWDEACAAELGWAIGRGEEYANPARADELESKALYELLENEIVPMFYERDKHGIPRRWVASMKQTISQLAPSFNSNRMVKEYTDYLYLPALERARALAADDLKGAKALAGQKQRLREQWHGLKVESTQVKTEEPVGVREALPMEVVVDLGGLEPEEVRVQAYTGPIDHDGRLTEGSPIDLRHDAGLGGGRHRFVGEIRPDNSGQYGLAVRVVPGGEIFNGLHEPGLIRWEVNPSERRAEEAEAREVTA